MKDKTYYILVDGKPVRVRASKRPDKETTKALRALVRAAYQMNIKPPTDKIS